MWLTMYIVCKADTAGYIRLIILWDKNVIEWGDFEIMTKPCAFTELTQISTTDLTISLR